MGRTHEQQGSGSHKPAVDVSRRWRPLQPPGSGHCAAFRCPDHSPTSGFVSRLCRGCLRAVSSLKQPHLAAKTDALQAPSAAFSPRPPHPQAQLSAGETRSESGGIRLEAAGSGANPPGECERQSRGVCATSGFVLQAVAQLRGTRRPCRRVGALLLGLWLRICVSRSPLACIGSGGVTDGGCCQSGCSVAARTRLPGFKHFRDVDSCAAFTCSPFHPNVETI